MDSLEGLYIDYAKRGDEIEELEKNMDYDEELHKEWVDAAMVKAYDFAETYCDHQCDGENDHLNEMNTARRALREHLIAQPASMALTDPELRAGIGLQRKEIDRMKQHLRDEGDRISELRGAIDAMRVAGGSVEFQAAFEMAKGLLVPNID